jgi:hypothetical protein
MDWLAEIVPFPAIGAGLSRLRSTGRHRVRLRSHLSLGPSGRKSSGTARSLAQRIRRLTADRLTKSALGAFDSLFEGELFGIIELLLTSFGFAKINKRTLILLVFDIIEAVTE